MQGDGARRRLSLVEILTGTYAASILDGLCETGGLDLLEQWRTPRELARATGHDSSVLAPCLQFVAITTNVLERDGQGRFRIANGGQLEATFQLRKFVGAYGPAVHTLGSSRVVRPALASAFAAVAGHVSPVVLRLVEQSGVRCLLDLGCGAGDLLCRLARADSSFHGIGIDENAEMCRVARRAVRAAGFAGRIQIIHGDARNLGAMLGADARSRIEVVHGRSFLNALFDDGRGRAISALRTIRRQLPGRVAWFVDYYGRLGARRAGPHQSLALLQDVAQVVSGQGIPPSAMTTFRAIYRAAGCRLLRADDHPGPHLTWFVHEVFLGSRTSQV